MAMIMDYEKKYNYVLGRAERLKKSCSLPYIKDWVDSVFPELQESEDERIRKFIIHLLDNHVSNHVSRKDIKECIAWLEKQGEKPADTKIMWHDVSEEPEEMKELLVEWDSEDATWHEVAFYGATTKSFNVCGKQLEGVTRWCYIDDIIKQAPKPKWTEEDEKMLKEIISDVKFEGYNNDIQAKSYKKVEWLKELKQRIEK